MAASATSSTLCATTSFVAHHTAKHNEPGRSTCSRVGLRCRTSSSSDQQLVEAKAAGARARGCGGDHSHHSHHSQALLPHPCRQEVYGWSVSLGRGGKRRGSLQRLRRALGPADRPPRSRSTPPVSASASAAPSADVRESSAASAAAPPAQQRVEWTSSGVGAGATLRNVVRSTESAAGKDGEGRRPLRVLVVGAGIGGLVFALAAKRKGIDVKVFERDASAVRGEGQYRGPIQVQSNALAALEAIDPEVAEEVMYKGTITGDRINGLVDGLTGEWYIKFDTWHPAVKKGLPVTRVISRMTLQEILSKAVGADIIQGNSYVIDYEDDGQKVVAILDDGRRVEGDLLVGADGIRSKVRRKLLGPTDVTYSDYTCYTGIADFVPLDIDTVGYRVFLGNKQYFVSSDVGHGKMQWYAFHYQQAGQEDAPGSRKEKLLQMFENWCDGVVDLLLATPEEMILRRDIYDRIPIMTWSKGRVTLLGDSAHAMQPNMGQGGCMAIEDGYELALDLDKAMKEVEKGTEDKVDVVNVLKEYEAARRLRVGAIHGMARLAAIMASTYITFMGGGLSLAWLMKLRIPHPGRVFGKLFMIPTMPLMLDWVLGGYSTSLEDRAPYCRIEDKATNNFDEHLKDDELLEKITKADWTLMRVTDKAWWKSLEGGHKREQWTVSDRSGEPVILGSMPAASLQGSSVVIDLPAIGKHQLKFTMQNGAVFMEELPESTGTSLNGSKLRKGSSVRIRPGDVIEMGGENQEKVTMRVRLERADEVPVARD